MSMAEPLMPHPEDPDTAGDEHRDAPVQEPHGEPAEANDTLTSAGRSREERDELPLFPGGAASPERVVEETPE
ncbi:hypothetical protein QDR37_11350 [Amnibacterium sp. CER49]|uniref:hypothetical protein n=1 Tax=Amnibacterium sp. CER49 TaxID=3039161 RepID=UPI002446C877|nr:hypothetical protein [Amnibacterium sp. CER49]MDH2444541.1 hypothetical protein [Amnibacterium sp. CER49]